MCFYKYSLTALNVFPQVLINSLILWVVYAVRIYKCRLTSSLQLSGSLNVLQTDQSQDNLLNTFSLHYNIKYGKYFPENTSVLFQDAMWLERWRQRVIKGSFSIQTHVSFVCPNKLNKVFLCVYPTSIKTHRDGHRARGLVQNFKWHFQPDILNLIGTWKQF